jgi:hypothetical protein
MGELVVTNEQTRFAIKVLPPREHEGIVEYTVRCGEEMERRRLVD